MFYYRSQCVIRLQVAHVGVLEVGPKPALASEGAGHLTGPGVHRRVETHDVVDGDVVDAELLTI